MTKASKRLKRREIFVLDTNVLLYNPKAIFAFPGGDVIIPDQVLVELDRLKTARTDKELRFRGREFSRILFDISEHGRLTDGIPFGDDSTLRVAISNPQKLPDKLSPKNTDDRILGLVLQLQEEQPERRVTVVTNDLNMLVKAQMLDLPVTRPGEEFAYGRVRRTFVWLGSQKKALSLMATVLALVAAIVFASSLNSGVQLPPNIRQAQSKVESNQRILDRNPNDVEALKSMGDAQSYLGDSYEDTSYDVLAIDYYKKALDAAPKNTDIRFRIAYEYQKLNKTDDAIAEYKKILSYDRNNAEAHYSIGTVLAEAKGDLKGALGHFETYMKLEPNGAEAQRVIGYIQQIKQTLNQQ